MKLNPIAFEQIHSGLKTIELRLYDPKRRVIEIGDEIIFSKLPDLDKQLTTTVQRLTLAPTFAELFLTINPIEAGFVNNETLPEMVTNMLNLYSTEKQNQFGVVAIHLALPKNKDIDR